MKKKGFIGRLAAVALVLCMVTMSLTAGTLAKYTSSETGSATATVAKWKVAFKNGSSDFTASTPVKLTPLQTYVDDKLVKADKIAPEIKGQLDLVVDGTGTEVAFDYTIELDLGSITKAGTTAECPLKFYEEEACTTEIAAVSNKVSVTGTVLVPADGATDPDAQKSTTIYWKWVGTNDTTDTDLGKDSAKDSGPAVFTIPTTITATQKTSTT